MKPYINIFVVTSIIFLLIDAIWLRFVAWPLYQRYIGHLLKTVNVLPAFVFYVIYVLGMIFFVINPNLNNFELSKVLLTGFFFGVVAYATYDLTNMATLKDWPWTITIIDVIWGGFVTMVTTTIVTYIFRVI